MAIASIPDAIAAFPKPTTMAFSFNRSWGMESAGMWAGASNSIMGYTPGSKGLIQLKNPFTTETGSAFLQGLAQALQSSAYTAAVQAGKKIGINQHNVMLFQDLPFREVSLNFNLQPRTAKKASEFMEAINFLKAKSAPMLIEQKALWDVSDCVFKLEFQFQNVEGPPGPGQMIFQSQEMAITNITTDYTPSGFWSQHMDGYPTQTALSLQLQELTLAYRQSANDKYLTDGKGGYVV